MATAPPHMTGRQRAVQRLAARVMAERSRLANAPAPIISRQVHRHEVLKARKAAQAAARKAATKAHPKVRGPKVNDKYPASPTGAAPINRVYNLSRKLTKVARTCAEAA